MNKTTDVIDILDDFTIIISHILSLISNGNQ
jgi:hypothetical protein